MRESREGDLVGRDGVDGSPKTAQEDVEARSAYFMPIEDLWDTAGRRFKWVQVVLLAENRGRWPGSRRSTSKKFARLSCLEMTSWKTVASPRNAVSRSGGAAKRSTLRLRRPRACGPARTMHLLDYISGQPQTQCAHRAYPRPSPGARLTSPRALARTATANGTTRSRRRLECAHCSLLSRQAAPTNLAGPPAVDSQRSRRRRRSTRGERCAVPLTSAGLALSPDA